MQGRDNSGKFKPGHTSTGGRKPGAKNKVTQAIRERFKLLLENNLDKLEADLNGLKPKERVDAILALAQYVVPKLQSVAYRDETPLTMIKGIQIISSGRYLPTNDGEDFEEQEYDGYTGKGRKTVED